MCGSLPPSKPQGFYQLFTMLTRLRAWIPVSKPAPVCTTVWTAPENLRRVLVRHPGVARRGCYA